MKITIQPFGKKVFFFDSYGSYMQMSFTIQCDNSDMTITKMRLKANKKKSNQELHMIWGYLIPINSNFVDYNSLGKRAHPLKISKDGIEPFTINFYATDNKGSEFHQEVEKYRDKAQHVNVNEESVALEFATEFDRFARERFFWEASAYELDLEVLYNNGKSYIQKSNFVLSEDNEKLLLSNIAKIISRSDDVSFALVESDT